MYVENYIHALSINFCYHWCWYYQSCIKSIPCQPMTHIHEQYIYIYICIIYIYIYMYNIWVNHSHNSLTWIKAIYLGIIPYYFQWGRSEVVVRSLYITPLSLYIYIRIYVYIYYMYIYPTVYSTQCPRLHSFAMTPIGGTG